jgi:succinate-acetate transporter protein
MLFGLIFEWIMGNFFSMMIMGMFAVYWLSFAPLETPSMGIAASYSATGDAAQGAETVGYNAAIALYLMVWGFWLLTSLIFALKTNIVMVIIFLLASLTTFMLGAAYWKVSTAEFALAANLEKVRPASDY